MKTIKKISLPDGTLMFLNEDYNDDYPGSCEAIRANQKVLDDIGIFKMELNAWYGIAGEVTIF